MRRILLVCALLLHVPLAFAQSKLYGLTFLGGENEQGVLYRYDVQANSLEAVVSFDGSNGRNPYYGLTRASDNKLYGMTFGGGDFDFGVIFCFNPATSSFTVVHHFDGPSGALPMGDLLQASNGLLYGLASGGGLYRSGGIFSFNPATKNFQMLHAFNPKNPDDGGYNPIGSLIQAADGTLYGYARGGTTDGGILFSYTIPSGLYRREADGIGPAGSQSYGRLLQASDGKLYGTFLDNMSTTKGGLFSFTPATGTVNLLHQFNGVDGQAPYGSLVQGTPTKLFGMTSEGGAYNKGVIYAYDIATQQHTVVHSFNGTDGARAREGLLLASNKMIYGTTQGGGALNQGVLFRFDPASGAYTKLQDFNGPNGAQPVYGGMAEVGGCTAFPVAIADALALPAGAAVNTVYRGYSPAAAITLKVALPAGKGYTYKWSTGSTAASIRVSPTAATTYSVTVTNAAGCTATATRQINVVDVRCGKKADKVMVCKVPQGKPANRQAVCVSPNAVPAQLAGGASLGSCGGPVAPEVSGIRILSTPNPSTSHFNLVVRSENYKERIIVRVSDAMGRIMETLTVTAGQTFQIGARYPLAIYYVEAIQGKEKASATLAKSAR